MFLQDIGVGVKIVCWFKQDVARNNWWRLRRLDTRTEYAFVGPRTPDVFMVLHLGINLGLAPQGKQLVNLGYTRIDPLLPLHEVYFAGGGMDKGYATQPSPSESARGQRKLFLAGGTEQPQDLLAALVLGEVLFEGRTDNFGYLYEVAALK
jgi:hypothetical protein